MIASVIQRLLVRSRAPAVYSKASLTTIPIAPFGRIFVVRMRVGGWVSLCQQCMNTLCMKIIPSLRMTVAFHSLFYCMIGLN